MKTTLKMSAVALALAGAIGSAQALDVAANTAPAAGPPSMAAALGTLLDSLSTAITTPTFTGMARAAVYDGPEAGMNLNFYYQFSNTGGAGTTPDSIARMSAGGFGTWATDVFQSDVAFGDFVAGTVAANTVDRGNTGVIGFNFTPNGVMPGESTSIMEVRTSATDHTRNWMAVIDSTGGFAPAFAPTAAIPEPETYALMLAGLGLLGFVGRRRIGRDNGAGDSTGRGTA